jgi:hypothetical protein
VSREELDQESVNSAARLASESENPVTRQRARAALKMMARAQTPGAQEALENLPRDDDA